MKAERKNSKLEFKVFFKVLKFSFFINFYGFFEFFFSKYHEERCGEWGKGYTGTRLLKEISKMEFTCKLLKSH